MKLRFLTLPAADRGVYFQEAAARRQLHPVVLEKDFWVCWLLGVLFTSRFSDALVFKGGTSLSKVFGVIDRFSEDIDLSLSPEFLGLPDAGKSRNQADKWMKAAEKKCGQVVQDDVMPALEATVESSLGVRETPWFEFLTDPGTNSPVLFFHYETALPTGFEYLRRSVKLEFGSLTDQKPAGRHPIHPWLAEILEPALPDWNCEVVALEIERTFWEKATILHAEYHRPADKATPDRFSRHYADTAALGRRAAAVAALSQHELRDKVVAWKSQFFGSGWARYDLAKPGTFKLVPPLERQAALRRDYQAMRDMYLTTPTDFDGVLADLAELERRINGTGG
ncbi:MAG: nucleotidyl transferase AbiEii/AbiGii toxin family protein [Gemmataceae bacterium]